MDLTVLEKMGLHEKEIAVYVCLLKTGSLSGGMLATKTGLHRRTTYDVLDALEHKGLVSFAHVDGVKLYTALEPSLLLDQLEKIHIDLAGLVPQLETLRNVESRADAQIYQGPISVKRVLDGVLRCKEYSVFGEGKALYESLGPYFHKFQMIKEKRKILSRILLAETYRGHDVSTASYGELRYINQYETLSTTYIYGKNVAIIIAQMPMAIVISNELVQKSFLAYFNLLWGMAKS